jgi:hypothetical protein
MHPASGNQNTILTNTIPTSSNHDIPQKDITMFGETILALNKMKNHPNYRSEYKGIWDMFTKQPAHPKRTTGFFVLNNIQKK